jgi:hypothetical protein
VVAEVGILAHAEESLRQIKRASEQRQRAKEAEDACASLRSRVAEIERERDALRITPEAIR